LSVNGFVDALKNKTKKKREDPLEKICALARVIAILVAIIAAFVVIPQVAVILLVLGGIAAITNTAEDNLRIYLVTVVLILGAKMLEVIPVAGVPLAAIFGNIATAMVGCSIVAITLRIIARIKSDWVK
jgi:hypothetical protein